MTEEPNRPTMDIVARHSVRRRLTLAFVGISALVVFAAAVAILALSLNKRSQDRISQYSVPVALESLDLTRIAQRIIGAVPKLVAAKDTTVQQNISDELKIEVRKLNVLLDVLREREIDPRAGASIERAAEQLAANIEAINRLVTAKITIAKLRDEKLDNGLKAAKTIHTAFSNSVPTAETSLQSILANEPEQTSKNLRLAHAMYEAEEIVLLLGGYKKGQDSETTVRALISLDVIRKNLTDISSNSYDQLLQQVDDLQDLFSGPQNLDQLSNLSTQFEAAASQALLENQALAQRFGDAVDRMLAVVKSDVETANSDARTVQRNASWLLFAVVFIAVISSILILRFYIQRNILARLTSLSSSMMAIANGDLNAEIRFGGDDELGAMAKALLVFRDTAVEVKETNLREINQARSRLRHAIESIQEGFALYDRDDKLTLCNSQFGTLLYEAKDVPALGTSYRQILRDQELRKLVSGVQGVNGDWVLHAMKNHKHPSGSALQLMQSGRWINVNERKTDDGGTVAVFTDVTAAKRHEQELDDLVDQLRSASEAKSSFIANVSHELRTPLTAVLGFAQIVQSRLEKIVFPETDQSRKPVVRAVSQVRENIGIMILEGQRLTKMINDILDLEKIEAGQMIWDLETLNVGSIIKQAAASTESLYRQKGLELEVDIQDDLPSVTGDHDRLVQVVINLISNAVKFTDQGTVTCRAFSESDAYVSVSISDTGTGIAPENQIEVFDKFRQVGDTLTEKPSGTGLGLPICREIINDLGGSISVESELGRGSTFTFKVPATNSNFAET